MSLRKTWLKVKRGLLEPKHRSALGIRVWLYLYMVDRADWDTGKVFGWRDRDAAADLGMPERTVQDQRQQLVTDGYITCEQEWQSLNLTIHNWTNPREYSGQVYNQPAGTQPEDVGGASEAPEGTESSVPQFRRETPMETPIHTQSSVPLPSGQNHKSHDKSESAAGLAEVLDRLSLEFPRHVYESWIRNATMMLVEGRLMVVVGNAYAQDWWRVNVLPVLPAACRAAGLELRDIAVALPGGRADFVPVDEPVES